MAIVDRLYVVVGVTQDQDGSVKVRYCGNAKEKVYRVKMYQDQGCRMVEFYDLPEPMNKIDACNWLLAKYKGKEIVASIKRELSKKEALVTPAAPKKRGRKPKAKVAQPVKVVKPKVVKSAKATPVAASKKEIGEIETLEVIEDTDIDDFDLREFQKLAAEQI